MKKPLGGAFGTNLFDVCQDSVGRAEARRTPTTGREPNPSECVKCLEGNPMLHLYSTVLLAVIAANASSSGSRDAAVAAATQTAQTGHGVILPRK
jgi:hypothetical protein